MTSFYNGKLHSNYIFCVSVELEEIPIWNKIISMNKKHIQIVYCTQCKWLLRAAWMAQELLTTFENELEEVSLVPGRGGVFDIMSGDEIIWSRKEKKRFPNITELKQIVRDRIAPDKDLGHSDR